MLRALTIRNFAVVSELALEFAPGLNVFTGQTGAGKSILIEALGFLLGARASMDWLRTGEARLEVAGTVDAADIPKKLQTALRVQGASIVLRREFDASGKTRAFIHNQTVSLATLAELGDLLVDFHGQHEHQTLLKAALQLELLDGYGGLGALQEDLAGAHARWTSLVRERDATQLSEEERFKRLDLYRFQIHDIEETSPKPGEEEELEAVLPRLKSAGRLKTLSAQAYALLYDQEGSAQELMLKAERSLEELARIDPSIAGEAAALSAARAQVQETASRLCGYRDRMEDPGHAEEVLTRLDHIGRLKKKYGATVADVLSHRDKLKTEITWLENSEERTEELGKAVAKARRDLERLCAQAHKERMAAGARLAGKVAAELQGLGMPEARFSISAELEEERLTAAGSDAVEFLIAPNPGEPLKPLKFVASGGELSRVMLALKTVLAKNDRVGVLVFDEVDAGVGGEVGLAVGRRLAALGKARQVLCVTHLPQVACFADRHFHVAKEVTGGRTFARVERLDGEARLAALARMLGGQDVTATSRRHARELLEACR